MIAAQRDFPLLQLNTFQVAATASCYVELKDISEIREFLASDLYGTRPRFILGGGSNVLFTKDFDGIIIRPFIKGIEKISENSEFVILKAGAGEDWDGFVAYCVEHDLGGVENLSFIPGSVGASPVQNIGAYGVEAGEVIHSVEGIDLENGNKVIFSADECRFSYRDSVFKNELKGRVVITHVLFRLLKSHIFKTSYPDLNKELDNYPDTTIRNIRQAVISIRSNKLPDPSVLGNAGSFFKNPVVPKERIASLRRSYPTMPVYTVNNDLIKLSAAWLIEHSGWKGKRWGRTGTYKKQPLIIVNHGGATGNEVLQCALKIQKAVMNHFAIRLEMEVNVQ
jgi:UDP-N-acetylmuramate dehydrogenase